MTEDVAFGLAWRGYHRDEVRRHLSLVAEERQALSADLEHASQQIEYLEKQLEALQEENDELRETVRRICRTPIEPDGLTERLRHMMEIAREEATEIVARAHAAREREEQERREIAADFELAMCARRAQALRAISDQEEAARDRAATIVAEARRQIDEAEQLRQRVLSEILATRDTLAEILPG